MQKLIFTIILLVVLMASCDTTKKAIDTNDNPKMDIQTIVGTNWKLTTLGGRVLSADSKQDIHFILHEDGRIVGDTGCNTFGGTYDLKGDSQISFGEMLSTLQFCSGLELDESEIMQVFELSNNYTVNGNMLMLNVGRRAPLAVFEAWSQD